MAPACSQEALDAEIAKRYAYADELGVDERYRDKFMGQSAQEGSYMHTLKTAVGNLNAANAGQGCDKACQIARRIADAKADWLQAKRIAQQAPGRAAYYEKQYIIARSPKGATAYKDLLETRYGGEAKEWAKATLERHATAMQDMQFMRMDYEAAYKALPRIRELSMLREREEEALRLAIRQREGGARAGDRRVVYEERELGNLQTFRTVMIVLLYVILVAWLLFSSFFRDQMYRMWFVWLGILIYAAWPWIAPWLARRLVSLRAWVGYQWSDRAYRNVALSV